MLSLEGRYVLGDRKGKLKARHSFWRSPSLRDLRMSTPFLRRAQAAKRDAAG